MTAYWINTISLEHVLLAVEGGFTQADHGAAVRLRRLTNGDRMVFYSPRTAIRSGDPLQQFIALGTVTDDEPYQEEMSPDWKPWRRRIAFESHLGRAPAKPLVGRLSFVTDEKRWGYPFRRGLFEVPEADFVVIESAMREGDAALAQ